MKKSFFLIIFSFILFLFLFTTSCPAKQMNILVHPFENTGDKEYSWISAGMTDTVISDLTRIQNISVVSNQDRKKIEEKPKPKLTAYEWYAKGLEVQDTNPKEALTNFRKALDIDPNYTDALMSAGVTAGNTLNLFNEALGYLEMAGKIFKGRNETKSSDYAGLMNNIGNVYQHKGQLDRALEYYLKDKSIEDRLGLQNTVGYAMLMNNMAVLYEKQGQRNMAGRCFRMAYDTYVRSDYSGESRDKAPNNARRLGY
jgi:protein O-GlcNAc transferase